MLDYLAQCYEGIVFVICVIMICLQSLMKCKEDVMEKFGLRSDQVEISMGMSNDFQQAVSNLLNKLFSTILILFSIHLIICCCLTT